MVEESDDGNKSAFSEGYESLEALEETNSNRSQFIHVVYGHIPRAPPDIHVDYSTVQPFDNSSTASVMKRPILEEDSEKKGCTYSGDLKSGITDNSVLERTSVPQANPENDGRLQLEMIRNMQSLQTAIERLDPRTRTMLGAAGREPEHFQGDIHRLKRDVRRLHRNQMRDHADLQRMSVTTAGRPGPSSRFSYHLDIDDHATDVSVDLSDMYRADLALQGHSQRPQLNHPVQESEYSSGIHVFSPESSLPAETGPFPHVRMNTVPPGMPPGPPPVRSRPETFRNLGSRPAVPPSVETVTSPALYVPPSMEGTNISPPLYDSLDTTTHSLMTRPPAMSSYSDTTHTTNFTDYGKTSFIIKNDISGMINWKGISISYEKNSVDYNAVCIVTIKLITGDFNFPAGFTPVSCLYLITVSETLRKPVKVEMEHCVKLTSNDQSQNMTFFKTSSERPHTFRNIAEGQFPKNQQYGNIYLSRFSGIGSGTNQAEACNTQYFGMFYYEILKRKSTWKLWLVVGKDLKNLKQRIERNPNWEEVHNFLFYFDENKVLELKIAEHIPNNWNITAGQTLKISKHNADEYGTSNPYPACCYINVYVKSLYAKADVLNHTITLSGIESDTKEISVFRVPGYERLERQNGKMCSIWTILIILLSFAVLLMAVNFGHQLWTSHSSSSNDIANQETQNTLHKEFLETLEKIPLTNKIHSFCSHVLDIYICDQIEDEAPRDFDLQRKKLLQNWRINKLLTRQDFVTALDKTEYCEVARSIAKKYSLTNYLETCKKN